MGEMEVRQEEGTVLVLCAECFVQRGMVPMLPWRELFESSMVTDDKTRQSQGSEWPQAAVDDWTLYD